jgi:hypothetical protein
MFTVWRRVVQISKQFFLAQASACAVHQRQCKISGARSFVVPGLPPILNELATALTNGILNNGGGKNGLFSNATINPLSTNAVNSLLTNQPYSSAQPKAYLNWMILDENFNFITSGSFRNAHQVPLITSGG